MFEAASYSHLAVFEVDNLLGISYLRNAEFFGNLGTYLCGVSVNSLTSAKNYVIVAKFFNGLSQRVRCCQGVGTAECTVGEDNAC